MGWILQPLRLGYQPALAAARVAGVQSVGSRNTCDVCSWTIFHVPLIRFKRTVQATRASIRFSDPNDIANGHRVNTTATTNG